MRITIRKGTEKDNEAVENITREAFWNLYVPGCDEHYLIHKIWFSPDFLRDLYFVGLVEDKIVGAIVFTASHIENDKGHRIETVTFGPVCVLPEYQRIGIGSELIKAGLEEASKLGYSAVIILGDPHNYCRHGFRSSKDYGISNSAEKYPLGQLVRLIGGKDLPVAKWKFIYSDVYNLDSNEVDEFDHKFPKKEKMKTHTQDLFGMLIRAYVE